MTQSVSIAIVIIPGTAQSAVYGLMDLFQSANRIIQEMQPKACITFNVARWSLEPSGLCCLDEDAKPQLVVVPPVLEGQAYLEPQAAVCDALRAWYQQGAVISSACAGAFLLAQAGMLKGRTATTHWQLEALFRAHYPSIKLDIDALLVADPDLVTAGGVMSWVDLGLHLMGRYVPPSVVQALGRFMLVDTGTREQRYYRGFAPVMSHSDKAVLQVQHYIHREFASALSIERLASEAALTERTFLRRFQKATGLSPTEYVAQQRAHKAREWLENTTTTVDRIAWQVGYEDVSAFRRMFQKQTGLTPSQYRDRNGR
jgi:transcriptional regulator GlxA family with amidase domain